MRINPVLLVFELVLLAWFFGCIVTYKIGRYTLADGMGIHSAEFLMLLIFAGSIFSYLLFPAIGCFLVLGALLFWLIVQFFFTGITPCLALRTRRSRATTSVSKIRFTCFHKETTKLFPTFITSSCTC